MADLFRTVLLRLYALDIKKVAGAKVLVNSVDAPDANGRTNIQFSRSYTMNENGEALDKDGNPLILLPVDANKAIHYLFRFKTNLGQFSNYDIYLVPGDPIDFQTLRNLGKIDFSPDFYAKIDAHIDERINLLYAAINALRQEFINNVTAIPANALGIGGDPLTLNGTYLTI